uniref:Transmembrane protein 182 n=1 Tax=Neogobius melanostomus TaxID=47308 RepID=A0A8C6U2Y9_9GOBI
MKIGAAALFGGVLGVLGTLCFFLAFATDYWLVASDNCGPTEMPKTTQDENGTITVLEPVSPSSLTLLHEGFFWRCSFQVELSAEPHLATLFSEYSYVAIHSTTIIFFFRGFWTVLMILALLCAPIGGFLLVCGIPFYSHKLYRVGGALLIAAACLFLSVLLLYVMWMELVDVKRYILQEKGESCPGADVQIHYGLSFMVAAAAVPLVLTSGTVFMCVARALSGDKL